MNPEINLCQLYEQHYFFEISRRDQLDSKVTIPLGVTSILISAWFVMASAVVLPPVGIVEVALVVGLGLAAIAVVTTLSLLAAAYFNYEYKYVSTTEDLEAYRGKLIETYVSDASKVDAEFASVMLKKYTSAQHHNAVANDRKSTWLHRSTGGAADISSARRLHLGAVCNEENLRTGAGAEDSARWLS